MVTKPKFNVEINQRLIILLISAIIIVSLAVIFLQIGTASSTDTRIGLTIFMIVIVIAVIIIYKTIKSFSVRFAVKMRG